MAYTPTAYTDAATVKRLLRVCNNKITVSDDSESDLSNADLASYILDASRFIDSLLRPIVTSSKLPLTTTYSEISYAAPRVAAYLIYRDLYQAFRKEDIPAGPRGWIDDAQEFIKIFIYNVNMGLYSTLSPSKGAPAWDTVSQLFQTQIGVDLVDDDMRDNITGSSAPTISDNIGPQQSGQN